MYSGVMPGCEGVHVLWCDAWVGGGCMCSGVIPGWEGVHVLWCDAWVCVSGACAWVGQLARWSALWSRYDWTGVHMQKRKGRQTSGSLSFPPGEGWLHRKGEGGEAVMAGANWNWPLRVGSKEPPVCPPPPPPHPTIQLCTRQNC